MSPGQPIPTLPEALWTRCPGKMTDTSGQNIQIWGPENVPLCWFCLCLP